MLTILSSLLVGAAVGALLRISGLVHTLPGAITPGVLVTLVAAVLIMRRFGKKLSPLVEEAQRHMQAGRRELALKSLREALKWKSWHPLLESQLRVQIGVLLYAQADYDGAIAELSRAASKPWEGPAFLGCAYFKKHNEAGLVKAFEKAIKAAPKEGLAYTVYAWCMNARGKKAEAAKILERGIAKAPNDERLKTNLELVQQGKKLKVAPYGDRWAAFGLDGAMPGVPKGARGYAQRPGFRPGFRQKPQRR